MFNMSNDLAKLTEIPESFLQKLSNKIEYCISYDLKEGLTNNESCIKINLDFGILTLVIQEDSVKYLFMPSKQLEKNIVQVINNETDPLTVKIEETLCSRIMSTYKELF